MKKIILSIALLSSMGLFLSSCEKDEDIITFDEANAKAGTLSITTTSLVLEEKNNANEAITFNLTKADFGYQAGISYTLQLATKESNFAKPTDIALGNLLTKKYTVKELNSALINMGAIAGSTNNIQARIIASIGDKIKSVTSNVVDFTATPYFQLLNYPKIYVPGDYQGWAPDKAEVLASIDFSYEAYEGYINFTAPTTTFKFTPEPNWDNDYGDDGDGTSGKLKEKGKDIKVTGEGYYFIKANTTALTWSAVKTSWGVVGDAAGSWDTDKDMTYDPATKIWSITLNLLGGKSLKFRANDAWDINYGDGAKDGSTTADGFLDFDASDIKVPSDGNYTVTLDLSNPGNYKYGLKKN